MVEISEVKLIECPDCKRIVLDNVNYCRFCGHDFNEVIDESSGRLSRFLKNPLRGVVSDNIRHCTHCKSDFRDFSSEFCDNCGERIPYQGIKRFCSCGNVTNHPYCGVCSDKGSRKEELTAEEFYQIWHNQVIVPLSKAYNEDLSNNNFQKFFKLTNEQTNHIIYQMVHSILFKKINGNIIDFFKTELDETKINYKDIGKAIFNALEHNINEMLNHEGLSSFTTTTLKASFTETIETPHIKNKHGTGTKVLATAVAGPLGFVATSGVKQETETKQVHHKGDYLHTKVIITNENVSYLTYSDQNSSGFYDNRNDIDKIIVEWKDIKDFDDNNYFILNSGETFKCPDWTLYKIRKQSILEVIGTINEQPFNNYYNETRKNAKKIIVNIIKQLINSNQIKESNSNSILDLEALEKIMNMYKEGLLTDEEFTTMKQNIIGNNNVNEDYNNLEKNDELLPKFCANCGAEISEGSKFCIQCGTKIKE